jgi:hypothetical protein
MTEKKIGQISVHSSRTIMVTELEKIMDFSIESGDFFGALRENVFGKKSSDGIQKTGNYLRRLYGFEKNDPAFMAFLYFWKSADSNEKPLLALVYAVNRDYLLRESMDVIINTRIGEKAAIEEFETCIEKMHPNQYSPKTRKSMAQNIASSWKQAGFITGKVKNIRTTPQVTFKAVAFAMLLSYLGGERGDFIMHSLSVNALCLSEAKIRELTIEASKRDYLQYQYAGSVTVLSFDNLLKNIGINAI